MRTFLNKLRGLREDNDLTQTQIAEILGTSQTMYARYERGANEMPIRHLVTLCRFYNGLYKLSETTVPKFQISCYNVPML